MTGVRAGPGRMVTNSGVSEYRSLGVLLSGSSWGPGDIGGELGAVYTEVGSDARESRRKEVPARLRFRGARLLGAGSPNPSPPDVKTDSILRPPKF